MARPQRAVNIGSACRALANFGFSHLHLVAPEAELAEARPAAWQALHILDAVTTHERLEEALQPARLVIACSGWAPSGRRPMHPAEAARALREVAATGAPVAVVFGSERSGLSGAEIARADHLVRIPTDTGQPSLNLAAAVLLLAWELHRADTAPPLHGSPVDPGRVEAGAQRGVARLPASAGDRQRLLDRALGLLAHSGATAQQSLEKSRQSLSRLLLRARPSQREARILMGLLTRLERGLRSRSQERGPPERGP